MRSGRSELDGAAAVEAAAVGQAMEWYTRHREQPLTPAENRAFMEWLRASPIHVREYLAAAKLAEDLPRVAAHLRREKPHLLDPVLHASADNVLSLNAAKRVGSPTRRPRLSLAMAASLIVTVLAGGGAFIWWAAPGLIGASRAISVAHGEQRTLQLRDGSIAHLNTDTRISVRYSSQERLIEFKGGQALFQVARDPNRPFRVKAGATDVVAVGTQFQLYEKAPGQLTVTVVEGVVEVRSGARRLRLKEGEQADLSGSGVAEKPSTADLRVATAWVERELIFNEQALGEVAQDFNRYSSVPVVVEDATLRELRISGIFKAYDVESFIGFLQQFQGIEVVRDRDSIRVQRVAEKN